MTWRTILGLPLAGAVVMFLFLLMAGVITTDEILEGERKAPPNITITPQTKDSPTRPKFVDPPDFTAPPPPTYTKSKVVTDGSGSGLIVVVDTPTEIGDLPRTEPLVPIIRTVPSGFEGCIRDDMVRETVVVQFDITPTGETTNVQAVSSTSRCFERSAVRAVQNWRYRPKVVNGEPQWVYGEQTSIVFEVE